MNALALITATVEPGLRARWLREFPKLEAALVKLFGRPNDVVREDEVELQFGIPGIPSEPGGLVASVYVYTVHEALNINLWMMGCLYRTSIDHESRNPAKDIDEIIGKLKGFKDLAESQGFKDLVRQVAAGAPAPMVTRFGSRHGFSSYAGDDIRDAIRELKTGQQASAMRDWARQ